MPKINIKKEYEQFAIIGENKKNNQVEFHFENGYGASVINGPGTYGFESGLFELGVLSEEYGWNLTYDTPITNDVIGYLSEDQVYKLLNKISKL